MQSALLYRSQAVITLTLKSSTTTTNNRGSNEGHGRIRQSTSPDLVICSPILGVGREPKNNVKMKP